MPGPAYRAVSHGAKGRATDATANTLPSAIGHLLTGHEKIRQGYQQRCAHKLQQERAAHDNGASNNSMLTVPNKRAQYCSFAPQLMSLR